MTILPKQPCPIVSPGACLHPDNTGWQSSDQSGKCSSRYFGFNQNRFAILVNTVNSEHIFSKIDTDSNDGHNESLQGYVCLIIAQELIRCLSRGSLFHSLKTLFNQCGLERKSRYTIILRLRGKDSFSVNQAFTDKFLSLPSELR